LSIRVLAFAAASTQYVSHDQRQTQHPTLTRNPSHAGILTDSTAARKLRRRSWVALRRHALDSDRSGCFQKDGWCGAQTW
jgi:hypothetical protein